MKNLLSLLIVFSFLQGYNQDINTLIHKGIDAGNKKTTEKLLSILIKY